MREGVAEEARDPHRHVDAGPAELLQGYDAQLVDPARRLVPLRADAEQRQHLGDVVAGGAHRAGAPHREADRLGVAAGVVEVALHQRLGHRLPGLPRQPRGHRARVDGVEVAARREHVDQPAQRRAGGAGVDEAAVEGVQHGVQLVGRTPQPRHDLRGREGEHLLHQRVVVQPGDRGRRPVLGAEPEHQVAGLRLDLVDGRDRLGALLEPQRGAQARARPWTRRRRPARRAASASTRLTSASPSGAWPSTCRPSRIWASLISHSQPSTWRMKSSNSSSSGRSSRPRSRCISAACISCQISPRTAGSLAGSIAAMLACSSRSCSSRAMSP